MASLDQRCMVTDDLVTGQKQNYMCFWVLDDTFLLGIQQAYGCHPPTLDLSEVFSLSSALKFHTSGTRNHIQETVSLFSCSLLSQEQVMIWSHHGQRSSCMRAKSLQLFVTPWTVAYQAPLSMGFSRQEHWSGLPCPPQGNLSNPGTKLMSLSFAMAGRFFTTSATREAQRSLYLQSY